MSPDAPNRGFPAVGQIGIAAIGAAILFRGLRLPIAAGCFAALIAATLNREGPPRVEPRAAPPAPPERARQRNRVQTTSEDSFPASDPPSWTPVSGTGTRH